MSISSSTPTASKLCSPRPVLITQNGRAASYLVNVEELDSVFDQMELSRDIEISRREFAEGKGIPQDVVFNRLHEKLLAMKHAEALQPTPTGTDRVISS